MESNNNLAIFITLNILMTIGCIIYCRFMSFYNEEEFLSEKNIATIICALISGPILFIAYYLLIFTIFIVTQLDNCIKYFADQMDKRRSLSYLYVSFIINNSTTNTKYLSIGHKKEVTIQWNSWNSPHRHVISFIDRNGKLHYADVDQLEMSKK